MNENGPKRVPLGVLYGLLAALFVWCAAYRIPFSLDMLRIVFDASHVAGAPFTVDFPEPLVDSTAKSLDLRATPPIKKGDHVVKIEGVPLGDGPTLERTVRLLGPGATLHATLARPDAGGVERTFETSVPIVSLADPTTTPPRRILILILALALPLLCVGLGFWVVAVRPRDPVAWLVLAMLLGFSQSVAVAYGVERSWTTALRVPGMIWSAAWLTTWPLTFPLFGVHFAGRLAWERRRPWLPWLVLAPVAAFAALDVAAAAARAVDARGLARLLVPLERLEPLQQPFAIASVTMFFIFMGSKTEALPLPDDRRRTRLLLGGGTLAMTPLLVVVVLTMTTGRKLEELPSAIVVPGLLAVAIFPVTLAYAIVVERAMDVRVAIRQGLRYAATRGAITTLMVVAIGAAAWNLWNLVNDPSANRPRKIQAIALSAAVAVAIPRGGRKLFEWTDRRFFREAYDAERVLTDLSDEVRTILETEPLLDTVLQRIGATLHVERLAVYLRDGERFVASRAVGYSALPEVAAPVLAENVRLLSQSGKPIRVRHDDPDALIRRGSLRPEVRALLDDLGAEIVLPLLGKRDVQGVLVLGPKKSEEPYSPSDARLLASVAAQTGLALENSRLAATIAQEIARRERMSREIEIARDVQTKLFPQKLPQIDGIDCAGACRPAQGVGGDYYDFLTLPGGRLGIALGDVAGKGIPAALLMASLQASLRGQRLSGPTDLSQMMGNLNRLIFDSSPENRYATFFYGELDPSSRRIVYVNAGHNAPMVFRASDGRVERLAASGPVIGLVDAGRYEQMEATLGPGDLLVVYSDGISEAMNRDDEEWGEARLQATVRGDVSAPASAILGRLFDAADAFASGAIQHDDMTVVIVRLGAGESA